MNRKFKPNRQGITLLFVISMIVLFLLMGTAFVVVSNTFNRESTNRSRSNQAEGTGSTQGNQIIDQAINQLIRGTDLRNVDSPLRTSDILADQYGYGVRAFVATSAIVGGSSVNDSSFIALTLQSGTGVADNGFDFRTLAEGPLSPDGLSGTFGGRVLSFTSGPAKGFSVRIYADAFNGGSLRFQIPTSTFNGNSIANLGLTNVNELDGSEVIINGRDFSGIGAAAVVDGNGEAEFPLSLGTEAGSPNREGESHATLTGTYLTTSNSVNEPWDAPDISTPFLSGYDENGALLHSFHSDSSFSAFGSATPEVDTDGDGVPDAVWMDLGLAIITNREGQRFRPLVAVQIKDLDGLLNVNAHSNRTQLQANGFIDQPHEWAGPAGAGTEPIKPRGLGMGPPEIDLREALTDAQLENILNGRYGPDELPGDASNDSFRSRAKHLGHPIAEANSNGTVGGIYGSSAMDIHGRFKIGSPLTSTEFGDLNYPDFMIGLPQIDMLRSEDIDNYTNEFDGNPYEMSLSSTAFGDTPFTTQDLERLLRPNDIDSRLLTNRLSRLIGSAERNQSLGADNKTLNLFTTDSYEIPMLFGSFVETINRNIEIRTAANGTPPTDEERVNLTNRLIAQIAFAPEFYFGLKMDINRPFGQGFDDNSNQIIDDPGEDTTSDATDNSITDAGSILSDTRMDLNYSAIPNLGNEPNPRLIFARNLYMLAMLLLEPVDFDGANGVDDDDRTRFSEAMAQWAVNVVDFRDADSIHTRFVYDPTPFDDAGWNPDTDASGKNLPIEQIASVWGCERPELLLTETLAVHLQNMEDDNGFKQRVRPESFAFFEVYNPWTQNRRNQTPPAELYDGRDGVELGALDDTDTSPIWRFEVERIDGDAGSKTGFKPLRYVYMADPTGSGITYDDADEDQIDSDIEIFFGSEGAIVTPGTQAVIGTQGFADGNNFQVFMGRRMGAQDDNLMLNETTRLEVNRNAGTITRYTGATAEPNPRNASIVFINQSTTALDTLTASPRKFSLSDPYEGTYPSADPNGTAGVSIEGDGLVYMEPHPASLDVVDGERITDTDIRMIRSEDGTNQDFRYVRLQRLADPTIAWNAVTNPYLTIDSLEVDLVSINGAAAANPNPPFNADVDQAVAHERGEAQRVLWGFQRENVQGPMGGTPSADHFYAEVFQESLGRTNDAFEPTDADGPSFAWLTWNNRPFVSHMEIMNVPYLAPDRLTYARQNSNSVPFSIDNGDLDNPFMDKRMGTGNGVLAGRYGHLLNFFSGETDAAGTNNFADAYKLLDFLEVPSRFVGNESWYLTNNASNVLRYPFNQISHFRAPGKINLNTIPPSEIGSTESIVWQALGTPGVNWNTFKTSLMDNPMRPAAAANLVPDATQQLTGSACTLLRPDPNDATMPLLDYASTNPADNAMRSAAFRNETRTRLANLTTNRSSVFAGWITVGYFHVDETDAVQNDEVGTQTGDQVRNRGFFIFDRSIPVAYEPGKNHNIDKAIRVKTIIQ